MATPASGGGSGAASWVSGWPSFAVVLLVALAAAYAFSPRPMPAFKPTVIAPEGLQVNAILRQGALFIAAGEQGRILLSESPNGPWKEARITPQRGSTLTQLRAIDAKTLIAVGHDGWIVRSEDGGLSWTEAAFDTEKSDPLLGVAGPYEGKLFAFGAFGKFMVSADMGKTWQVSASEFPAVSSGQRPAMVRLKEGPLLFCSFTDQGRDWGKRKGLPFRDSSGREFQGYGLFAALSFDEGRTWPVRKLVTPGGPERKQPGTDHGQFMLSETMAEPGGYISLTQARDQTIHLNTSKNHYAFNLAWLKEAPH